MLLTGSGLDLIGSEYYKNVILDDGKIFKKSSEYTVYKITGVINTNNNTNNYLNDFCFESNLPLFQFNINGLKAETSLSIPFITDKLNYINQEKTYPMCVIQSFPNDIKHTIEYAKEQFEFFKIVPEILNKWLEDPNYLDKLEENEKIKAKKDIEIFTVKYPIKDGIEKCREFAIDMFNENYNNSILKLLESFPPNHQTNDNTSFWSNGKKCPKPIILDITNKEHIQFIEATTELLLKCSKLDCNKYESQEFYIDNDLHVKWIMSASNMRANNYSIPIIDEFKTRGIVGNIKPIIPMTSSISAGLISLEILKYLIGFKEIENYKKSDINLTESNISFTNPIPAPMIEICGSLVNSWTKFEYNNDSTLDHFKKYYEKLFDTLISMIVIDTTMIYAEFLDSDVLNKNLSVILSEYFSTDSIPSNVGFNLLSSDNKELPVITINLKN